MRNNRHGMWYKALVIWLGVLLSVSGVPMAHIRAEEASAVMPGGATSTTADEGDKTPDGQNGEQQADSENQDEQNADSSEGSQSSPSASTSESADSAVKAASEQASTKEHASDEQASDERATDAQAPDEGVTEGQAPDKQVADERAADKQVTDEDKPNDKEASATSPALVQPDKGPTYASGTLSETVEVDSEHSLTVTVVYDQTACIPEGAELHVLTPRLANDADDENRDSHLRKALGLGEDERILKTLHAYVGIESDGVAVDPASDVEVTIETSVIEPAQSSMVEVAALDAAEHLVPRNLTDDKADVSSTKLAFSASHLGELAFATVAARQNLWEGHGLCVSLWVPRWCADREDLHVTAVDSDAPELDEGVDLLGCYTLQMASHPSYGTTLWLEARRSEGDSSKQQVSEELGGAIAYSVKDGALADRLFGPEDPQELVGFDVNDGQLLLAWDSGYRSASLHLDEVIVEGMMPEGTQGVARDVAQNYEDVTALLASLDQNAAAEVMAGTREVSTLAAYDITLRADGEEYQPDEGHPLTVTIVNDAIAEGQNLQVWHIADDGSVEVIRDFELSDGVVTFEAPGFSTYVLAAQNETATVALSTNFNIKASAQTYSRTTTVTFVDENKDPINGTITGTLNVRYTGTGPESNETNTIDMYSFADKLDPAIADEYDFSRVFVQLTATDQKDYRYIQVGDGSAIASNGSTTMYRAYLYMDSIAQNAPKQDYDGTWYLLSNGGAIDNMYIEFYHVAEASFYALDTRNDPVAGAEFSLYIDPDCYTPLEYKHEEVKAVSDKHGLVSFGKIPRGTYYMKETVVPDGYKKTTRIYTVVVDGETTIADVVHQDDDGSVIIANVLRMTLTKEWNDEGDHSNDSVAVTVYNRGEPIEEVTLNASNNWTTMLDNLDPNEEYMVSETSVMSNNANVTSSWIPHITYDQHDKHAEYYIADSFKKGKQYIIVTKTASGTRALDGGSSLTTTPITVNDEGTQISSTVSDAQLWTVDTITQDGIIALQNAGSQKYLDKGGKWMLNSEYPVPLYVRHTNDSGKMRFYHRANLNSAAWNYLYVWYSGGKEGATDNYANVVSQAAVFDIYRKVNVSTVDVTITNNATQYPMRIKNVSYPSGSELEGMEYDLYEEEEYNKTNHGEPLMEGLTAGVDGLLQHEDSTTLKLSAGTYYLVQKSSLPAEGYAPLTRPVKFTITRKGALKVALEDQEFRDYTYSTTEMVGETTLPVLQVPNNKPATVEVTLDVQGDYADKTREFEFDLTIPQGTGQISAQVNGVATVFSEDAHTFKLAHGQTLRLIDIPATVSYGLTQAPVASYDTQATADGCTVNYVGGNTHVITISEISGTHDNPARVTITETLPNADVPATGLDDNVSTWGVIVATCALAIAALLLRRQRRLSH